MRLLRNMLNAMMEWWRDDEFDGDGGGDGGFWGAVERSKQVKVMSGFYWTYRSWHHSLSAKDYQTAKWNCAGFPQSPQSRANVQIQDRMTIGIGIARGDPQSTKSFFDIQDANRTRMSHG